jgi:hypothetical protein
MAWTRRRKVIGWLGAGITALAVAVGLYHTSPEGPSGVRHLLTSHDMATKQYMEDHAKGWSTCPAAATECYRWKMQETTGNITDDLSGNNSELAPNGSPIYRVHTPVPQTTSDFERRAIAFDTVTDNFQASAASVGDQTTNDFTISVWFRRTANAGSADPYIVDKGAPGYSLYYDEGGPRFVLNTDDGGGSDCFSVDPDIDDWSHHFLSVVVDRDDTVHFYMDGVELGKGACAIDAGSITSGTNLSVGNRNATDEAWEGDLHDVMVSDGLMTLAEHQAIYTFAVPSNIDSYTQTTNWKWPIGYSCDFGKALGTFAGDATNPQWPVSVDLTLQRTETFKLAHTEYGNVPTIANLPAELTINGQTVLPSGRYNASDANSVEWSVWDYGSVLTATGGTLMSFNQGSPLLGIVDDSLTFNNGRYFYRVGDTAYLDIGTEDWVLEFLIKPNSAAGFEHYKWGSGAVHTGGYYSQTGGTNRVSVGVKGTTSGNTQFTYLDIPEESWRFCTSFYDASETEQNGFRLYCNTIQSSVWQNANDCSVIGTLTNSGSYSLGNTSDVDMAYAAVYIKSGWFGGGATNPTEWQQIHNERFYKLINTYPEYAYGVKIPETHTRASVGYIQKKEFGTNYFQYSEEFDESSVWTPVLATINDNSTTDPFGGTAADAIVSAVSAGGHYVKQSYTPSTTSNYTLSVWAKAGAEDWLLIYNITDNRFSYFNLNTGAAGANNTNGEGCVGYSDGWYRCYISDYFSALTAKDIRIYSAEADSDFSYTGDGSSDYLHMYGAQLELVGTMNAYSVTTDTIPQTTGSAYKLYNTCDNWIRTDYVQDNNSKDCKGLRIEASKQNTAKHTEDINSLASKVRITSIDSDNVTQPTPENGKYFDGMVADNTTNTHFVADTLIANPGVAKYVSSGFFKKGNQDWIYIRLGSASKNSGAYFDLNNGVVGGTTAANAGIIDYGGGIFRCWMSPSVDLAAEATTFYIYSALSDGTLTFTGDGVTVNTWMWGLQVEPGIYPTSYTGIQAAAALTRAADRLTWDCSYNVGKKTHVDRLQGTLTADVLNFHTTGNEGVYNYVANISDDGATDQISVYNNQTTDNITLWVNSTETGGTTSTATRDTYDGYIHKLESNWRPYSHNTFVDGVSGTKSTTEVPPNDLDTIDVGSDRLGTNQFNGLIRNITIYNTANKDTGNQLGTGFPAHGTMINRIGFPNEIDQWSKTAGVVITANAGEAPDGSITAEEVDFTAANKRVFKAVVGGGNIAAGELWCASMWIRRLSGDCTNTHMHATSDETGTELALDITDEWRHYDQCENNAGSAKGISFHHDPGPADCDVLVADAQYTEDQHPPMGFCTTCTGDANCTCNASYYSLDWSGRSTYVANRQRTGEIATKATAYRQIVNAGGKRTLWEVGNYAYLVEGIKPSFVVKNQAGDTEAITTGKPLGSIEQYREYISSWEGIAGLTNTNPRKYASLGINYDHTDVEYQSEVLNARQSISTYDPFTPGNQLDLNAYKMYVGCDSTGSNCTETAVESVKYYSRPQQIVTADETSLIYDYNATGNAYQQNAVMPRLECPSAATECWIWPMADYGGGQIIDVNGVVLTDNGSPSMQNFSGQITRGQGRRGIHFDATDDWIRGSAAGLVDIGAGTEVSIEAIARTNTLTNIQSIFGSSSISTNTAGYVLYIDNGVGKCCVKDGVNVSCRTGNTALDTKLHQFRCTATKTAQWDVNLYVDNVLQTGAVTNNATGSIANANPVTLGNTSAGNNYYWDGEIYEVRVLNVDSSAADVKASYQESTQKGIYWTGTSIGHFYLNEPTLTNGVGIKDFSGNGDHLTVVNSAPVPQYDDMPWPAGSGVGKPGIWFKDADTDYFIAGATTVGDMTTEDFSVIVRFRFYDEDADLTSTLRLIEKGNVAGYRCYIAEANGRILCEISDGVVDSITNTNDFRDNKIHTMTFSVDRDGNLNLFIDSTAATPNSCGATGSVTNAVNLRIGERSAGGRLWEGSMHGVMIVKGYAMTQADHNALITNLNSADDNLTYDRNTSTAKGLCYSTREDLVEGTLVTCFEDDQAPFAYDSDFCSIAGNERLCLGQPVSATTANIALNSEDSTVTWVNNNTNDTADQEYSPDGTKTADQVTATAGNGDIRQIFAAIAAVDHTYCQFIKRAQATNVAGFLRIITHSTHAVIASQAFTATSAWQKFCVTGTATLNDTRIETEITNNTDTIYWWGATLVADDIDNGTYCYTDNNAGGRSCSAPTQNYIDDTLISWAGSNGIVSSIINGDTAVSYLIDYRTPASANNRVSQLTLGTGDPYCTVYNSAGVLQQDIRWVNTTGFYGVTNEFDSQYPFYSGNTRRSYGKCYNDTYFGEFYTWNTDTAANWTMNASTNDLSIGMAVGAGSEINGVTAGTCVYER